MLDQAIPFHLAFPLAASLLLVCGLLLLKQASTFGVGPWTVTVIANFWAGLLFSFLWLLGGDGQPPDQLWQPAIIATLYVLGQVFMFSAIKHGDVSVATPVIGIKVVFVAVIMSAVFGERLPNSVWYAAALAALGIGMVQWTGKSKVQKGRVFFTVLLAIGSATSFALFDVLVQHWAPAWGAGRFLPCVYWMVSALSLFLLPLTDLKLLRHPVIRRVLLPGTMLIALQAMCIVTTLAIFGDAARVNVVYALRGMWGVALAWLVAKKWGGNEATLPRNVILARFVGATLLTLAVIMAIVAE